MGYTGAEYTQPEFLLMLLKKLGGSPSTTLVEYGTSSTAATSFTSLKSWTVGSDGGVLAAYRIDPDIGFNTGFLQVKKNGTAVAEMSTFGSPSGSNVLVGYSFDDNHPDCIDMVLAANGETIDLLGKKYSGTIYVQWLYFEYDIN